MTREEFLRIYAHASRSRSGGPRPILVGQAAPARANSHALLPFPAGCAGERLFRMSGWPLLDYLRDLDRVNTLTHFPGRSGKGDAFPLSEARPAAARLEQELSLGTRLVIYVGKANAQCYGWSLPAPFTPVPQPSGGEWAWLPHTSGVVPFWNDPANRARAGELFAWLRQKSLLNPNLGA